MRKASLLLSLLLCLPVMGQIKVISQDTTTQTAGSGGTTYRASGVIAGSVTSVATEASLSAQTLWEYTVAGGTLANDGDSLVLKGRIYYATNANNKTATLHWGTASRVLNINSAAPNGMYHTFIFEIVRKGAASAEIVSTLNLIAGSNQSVGVTTSTDALSSDVVIKITGTEGVATGSEITLQFVRLEFVPASGVSQLVTLGDSKTAQLGWHARLVRDLQVDTGSMWVNKLGTVVGTVAAASAGIDALLATSSLAGGAATRTDVLINWGTHDEAEATLPDETQWHTDYLYIIDAVHTKWPNARIFLMRPWRQGQDANAATISTRIDALIAARPTFVFAGPDEAVWLKGADDGATMTSDGIHYTTAGHVEAAAQWRTTLGY